MTQPHYYDKGDKVHLTAKFIVGSVLTDPTVIICRVKDPSGNVTVYTYALAQVTKTSTGLYYKDISIDESGDWYYRWEGTGAMEAAEESHLVAEVSEF